MQHVTAANRVARHQRNHRLRHAANQALQVEHVQARHAVFAHVAFVAARLLGIAYHLGSDSIYVGTDLGNVFRIDASGAVSDFSPSLSALGTGAVTGLAVAPAGFTNAPGSLVYVTAQGATGTIDLATGVATQNQGSTGGHSYSAIAFTPDGIGIVADNEADQLRKLDVNTGDPGAGFSALSNPEGIALADDRDAALVAEQGAAQIRGVQISDGTDLGAIVFAPAPAFNLGVEPSGMAWDGIANLAFGEGNGSLSVRTVLP